MKVLMVFSNPGIGGTETFAASICPYLNQSNCKVHFLNIWKDGTLKSLALQSQIPYYEHKGNSRHIGLKDAVQCIKLIKEQEYDLVMGFGIRVSFLLRAIKMFIARPVMIGLRNMDHWRKWYHIWADRITEGACDLLVPNSAAVAQIRSEREKTPSKKMVMIPNGIDTDYFTPSVVKDIEKEAFALPNEKLILTYTATMRPQKGHFYLLDIIEKLRPHVSDQVQYVMAGEGVLFNDFREKVEREGFKEVTLLGNVQDIRALLANSDIYLHPSEEEGMPRALMEAMAMGLPCVATKAGGIPEVIRHPQDGFLSDYGNLEAFSKDLYRLIESESLRKELGRAARHRIISQFSVERIAKKYAVLFQEIIDGNKDGIKIQSLIDNLEI